MTDLTEQLYAGTLPTGHYYFNNGVETYIVLYKNINSKHLILQEPEGLEVLCKVPSYEEYLSLTYAKEEDEKIIAEYEAENTKLKEQVQEFAESNQSLRKQLDGEKAKNRIDYYNGSPMDFLDECERDRKKNKIYKNLINNIREEPIISDLRSTDEGNKFIVNLLDKINQALGGE